MRRGISILTAAGLAMTLAACGGGSSDDSTSGAAEETTTASETGASGSLTIWVDDNREAAVTDAAKAYEDATGTTVDVVVKDFDNIRADFAAQVPTGEGPDITVGAHDWLGGFVKDGLVAPIELGDALADFNTVSTEAFTYDGQVYGLPYAIENVAVIRNTALADSTPATFDEMIAKGKAAGTKYPFLIQVGDEGDAYTMYAFQTSFGAPVFVQNDDGSYSSELGLGGENGNNFAQWLQDQATAGVLDTSITYDVAVDAFSKGESPYIVGGPWMISAFTDAGIDVAVDPIPSAGGETASPFVGVQGFYVNANSQNQLTATDFLVNYLGTEDAQVALYEAGDRVPALNAAADAVSDDPIVAGFAAAAENAVPMPSIPEMDSVWSFWGVTEANIINGTATDAPAAWTEMVSNIQAELDK